MCSEMSAFHLDLIHSIRNESACHDAEYYS